MNPIDYRSLAAMGPLNILDDEDQRKLDDQLLESVPCRDHFDALSNCFEALKLDLDDTPFEERGLWDKIVENADSAEFEDLEVAESSNTLIHSSMITLSCTFCRGSLTRGEAKYCATCLAPHHEECFREHGQCSTFGCEETYTVAARPLTQSMSSSTGAGPLRRSRLRMGAMSLWLAVPLATASWMSYSHQFARQDLAEVSVAEPAIDAIPARQAESKVMSLYEEFLDNDGRKTSGIVYKLTTCAF